MYTIIHVYKVACFQRSNELIINNFMFVMCVYLDELSYNSTKVQPGALKG